MSNSGWALLLAVCLLSAYDAVEVQAADRFVSTAGSDLANDCLVSTLPCGTVGYALTQAATGDTIKVAEGVYAEAPLAISGNVSLTISGGWSADFATQGSLAAKTKLNGHYQGPVLTVTAASTTVDVMLDTLDIMKGAGGIIASSGGSGSLTLALVDCLVEHNRTTTPGGGGISATATDTSSLSLTLTDSTFKSNTTAYHGGAIYAASGGASSLSLTATGSTFIANAARYHGGGIFLGHDTYPVPSGPMSVLIDDCTFRANRGAHPVTYTGGVGGAMAIDISSTSLDDLSVVNSVFRSNRAQAGGGISVGLFYGSATMDIVNSSFRKNRAPFFGGGIDVSSNASGSHAVSFKNTILWGNKAGDYGQDLVTHEQSPGTLTVEADHCDIGDRGGSGPFSDLGGNIDADPLLSGSLHLRPGSPAIDTGTCTGAPATDFEGDTRPTGVGCDIGADEFVP